MKFRLIALMALAAVLGVSTTSEAFFNRARGHGGAANRIVVRNNFVGHDRFFGRNFGHHGYGTGANFNFNAGYGFNAGFAPSFGFNAGYGGGASFAPLFLDPGVNPYAGAGGCQSGGGGASASVRIRVGN